MKSSNDISTFKKTKLISITTILLSNQMIVFSVGQICSIHPILVNIPINIKFLIIHNYHQ